MKKLSLLLLGMFLSLILGSFAYGAVDADKDKYVRREEYDELKQNYEALNKVVQQLLKQKPAAQVQGISQSAETTEALDNFENELKTVKGQVKSLEPGTTNFLITGYGFGEFSNLRNKNSSFTAGFNPIFLYKMSDRLLFEGELELELEDGATATSLEFADVSYILNDYMTVEAGKFLSPFGTFMERLHPKWINKLPDKPLGYASGSSRLAPEAQIGALVRGGIPLIMGSKANYALYVSNGPTLRTAAATAGQLSFTNTDDNNRRKAFGGRVGFVPIPDVEVGYSLETSRVGSNDGMGFNNVKALLQGIDFSYVHDSDLLKGTINLKAEQLLSNVDSADYQTGVGSFENDRWAHYFQASYRPSKMKEPVLKNLEGVFRFDQINHPSAAPTNTDEERYTWGMDYWLNSSTVLKIAYEVDRKDQTGTDGSGWIAQVSTGF